MRLRHVLDAENRKRMFGKATVAIDAEIRRAWVA